MMKKDQKVAIVLPWWGAHRKALGPAALPRVLMAREGKGAEGEESNTEPVKKKKNFKIIMQWISLQVIHEFYDSIRQ